MRRRCDWLAAHFLENISTTTSGTARSRRIPSAFLVVFSKVSYLPYTGEASPSPHEEAARLRDVCSGSGRVSYSQPSAVSTVRTAAAPVTRFEPPERSQRESSEPADERGQ